MSTALVTGATGQDGSYLCEQLAAEAVQVYAVVEDTVAARALPWLADAQLHEADLRDHGRLRTLVSETAPDEIYNLAGMSSVAQSWKQPVLTAEVNAVAVAVLAQAAWELQQERGELVRFVQASSAEIFGQAARSPQHEATPLAPTNPYGAAKAYAHQLVGVYRGLGLHAVSCVLYNHESPRRPETFVTRKITAAAARIARGAQDELVLGSLDVRRDWGWAPDYVNGMVLAGRHPEPTDFVLATGTTHTVAELVAAAFAAVGIEDWGRFVRSDPAFVRPVETAEARGDATRARTELGWAPTVGFDELVTRMVAADR